MGKRKKPKRSQHQRASDLNKESQLRKEGNSLRFIADKTGLSHEQVRRDLAHLDKVLLADAKINLEQAKIEALAKLRYSQIESVRGWELSLQDKERTTVKTGGMHGAEETTMREGQSGNPSHMSNYRKSVEAEIKLLRLDEQGTGKGDEAADRLLQLHALLEAMRNDTQKPSSPEP